MTKNEYLETVNKCLRLVYSGAPENIELAKSICEGQKISLTHALINRWEPILHYIQDFQQRLDFSPLAVGGCASEREELIQQMWSETFAKFFLVGKLAGLTLSRHNLQPKDWETIAQAPNIKELQLDNCNLRNLMLDAISVKLENIQDLTLTFGSLFELNSRGFLATMPNIQNLKIRIRKEGGDAVGVLDGLSSLKHLETVTLLGDCFNFHNVRVILKRNKPKRAYLSGRVLDGLQLDSWLPFYVGKRNDRDWFKFEDFGETLVSLVSPDCSHNGI